MKADFAKLEMGIKQLAKVVRSFEDRDWHQNGIGGIFTYALAACWRHKQSEVEQRPDLRNAFLQILTELCARQTPKPLHLRNRVFGCINLNHVSARF